MQEFNRAQVEQILNELDENSCLFPQFALRKQNNELELLGVGGFSSVYEMYNKERPELSFALKVIGFQNRTVSSDAFWSTGRIQWVLCQESKYIMRIIEARELVIAFDDEGQISEVKDATKEVWEEKENGLRLQFVLMEKLDGLIEKDKFRSVRLIHPQFRDISYVIKYALEIGQAIAIMHDNKCLHRDIKLENTFWDENEKIYKLGDFGIAKWAEDGNAETVVYTDGYGAPEIEKRLYDSYNATADIYSFGITLYLLLNDLKFPGSEGYYSKVEVQYNPEFVFPAPVHATEGLTRIIRKMCSFYSKDRYQSIAEVLYDLSRLIENKNIEATDDLLEISDMVTETFKVEEEKKNLAENTTEGIKTRAERKEEQRVVDILYREDSINYCVAITILLVFLYKGFDYDSNMITNWLFYVLPIAMLFEALLQKVKEFHIFFGTLVLGVTALSIYTSGLTISHICIILCILMGCPILTLATSISVGIWLLMEYKAWLNILDYIRKWDVGWVFLIIVLLVVNRYFNMRISWEKTTYIRAYIGCFIYDKMFIVMTIVGIVLLILQVSSVITIPDIVSRMHFIRTGIISFVGMVIFGIIEDDWDKVEGAEVAEDDI